MKTTVSIPDDVFERAERLARRTRRSRSQFYSDALREYATRHANEEVTEAYNALCDALGQPHDVFVSKAVWLRLQAQEW